MILGVGDFGAVNQAGEEVKTFALGSCVAVIFLNVKTRMVGMAHIALPDSSINTEKGKTKPGYFANTGIPALLDLMNRMGCAAGGVGMSVKLAGGASIMDPNNTFNIGKRNQLAIKKILWRYHLGALSMDVGGNFSRTVAVSVDTGKVLLSSPGKKDWEI